MRSATRQKPNILRRYRTFKPTNFDSHIPLAMDHNTDFANAESWFIAPVMSTRDDTAFARSNWDAQNAELTKLDRHGHHHELLPFGHWAVGHFGLVIVRPRSACWRAANDMAHALNDYAILDEHLCSEYEFDACVDSFDAREVARSLQHEPRTTFTLNKSTVEWIAEHLTFDIASGSPGLDFEMDGEAFHWRFQTDWRDEARWRSDVAAVLKDWHVRYRK